MNTWSFLDVHGTLVGPGGNISIGSNSGAEEEGISFNMIEDKNTMKLGADGSVMHSLHAGKGAEIKVRLLRTSPVNAKLEQLYNTQTTSSMLHGLNVIVITNNATGDHITCQQCAFKKLPEVHFSKDGQVMEWDFDVGIADVSLAGLLLSLANQV